MPKMPTKQILLSQLQAVMQDVFEDDALVIDPETTAADVPGWDSLQHVSLVLQVESCFGVRFSSSEVADLQTVGDLIHLIEKRQSESGR